MSFTYDMKNVPADWDLPHVLAAVVLNDCLEHGSRHGRRGSARAAIRAWYEDEHHGFNAEHIDVGGEGG
jgi:hypothetical protein